MASIFDQYEEAASRGSSNFQYGQPRQQDLLPEPIITGYVNIRTDEDPPIFSKQKINFRPPHSVTHLTVNNNFLVMAMSNNVLLRIDLEHPEQPDEVEIGKGMEDKIHKIFLDSYGKHLIISTKAHELLYLSRHTKKCKQLTKMKGNLIESVAWNLTNSTDSTTGEILMGTSKGEIYETEIVSGDESRFFIQTSLEQYWKLVYDLGKDMGRGKGVPVTGLEFGKMSAQSQAERKYFIMATTPSRLYQFLGIIPSSAEPPVFQYVFQNYEDNPASFLELPGSFGYSQLRFYSSKHRSPPKTFAWMAGPGVYYGSMNYHQDSVTSDSQLLQYTSFQDSTSDFQPPISMVITEFHILLQFPDRIKALCLLNEQLVYEDNYLARYGSLLGLCKDTIKGTIWSFTDQAVFKYKISKESRDVWQMYLDKGDFDLAKEYSKNNAANLDKVLTKEAEFHFKNKRYEKSANVYAETERSFEEVTLKFIQAKQENALKTFLRRKLSGLKTSEKTQTTMILTWMVELYLNKLGNLRDSSDDSYAAVQDEFQKFLAQSKYKDCLFDNRSTIYDLISSHGDVEDLVFFAVLMQDFDRVISHHIQQDNYQSALEMLTKQSNLELYYKFSPILMQHIPRDMVDAWIMKAKNLKPKRLIPALIQYDEHAYSTKIQVNEAVRYLEFCVQTLEIKDKAIHNYLLSLYAKHQPQQLQKYLHFQGQNPEEVHYDLEYALRLCSEQGLKKACVHIYTTMGLYEEAVDLALQVDVDLAKLNADRPEEDHELRKKLWLRIARHVVEEEKDIKRAMEFLHECSLLKIEDILPFFPDFVTIDHFKDAICTSLKEYNQHIESLKEEMKEATESAKEIRADIQDVRNKYGVIQGQQKCSSCTFPLLTRSFYLFPCQHMFHADCLVTEVMPHLSSSKRSKVEELQRRLASGQLDKAPASSAAESGPKNGQQQQQPSSADLLEKQDARDKTRSDLDDIVAAECVFCGDIMIRSIDEPFISHDEYDAVNKSWN